jgi:hypothetical protein
MAGSTEMNNAYRNPWNKPNIHEKCKHDLVLEGQRLICNICGETFKL